jgi:hypothetical protein
MFRVAIASAIIAGFIPLGTFSAIAQSAPAKPKYPAEIAAASKLLAEKQENCRLQAKQRKLTFLKRRRFVRDCVNKRP